MAKQKRTIRQTNFSLGQISDDALESDGLDLFEQSVARALNVMPGPMGSLNRRPGMELILEGLEFPSPFKMFEFSGDIKYLVVLSHQKLDVIDRSTATPVASFATPWNSLGVGADPRQVWHAATVNRAYLGRQDTHPHLLSYDGNWNFGPIAFAQGPGGTIQQPYYAYNPGVKIAPSGYEGNVTVTATANVFQSSHVGKRIKYHGGEIQIQSYTNPTTVSGTVVNNLPRSHRLSMGYVGHFKRGEIVTHSTYDYLGFVESVNYSNNSVDVISLKGYGGPPDGGELVGPNGAQLITGKALLPAPKASPMWEEPLMSPSKGYPGSGAFVGGRLFMTGFPSIPDMVIGSSVRDYQDFGTGTDDGDAIIRTVGKGSTKVRHVVDGGDLVILADNGAYSVEAKGGTPITPSNFNAVLFDARGSNLVSPKLVGSSILYMSRSGSDLLSANLDGNVYLKWSVKNLSRLSPELSRSTIDIIEPPEGASGNDRYAMLVNERGFITALTYVDELNVPGFFPWVTANQKPVPQPFSLPSDEIWRAIVLSASCDSHIYSLVSFDNRRSNSGPYRLERFTSEGNCDLDCATSAPGDGDFALAPSIPDWRRFATVDGKHIGYVTQQEANGLTVGGRPGSMVWFGLPFGLRIVPWPKESLGSSRLGVLKARVSRIAISVKNTHQYSIKRADVTNTITDISSLPIEGFENTAVEVFSNLGNEDHMTAEITQDAGRFTLLAVTSEVQE